MHCLRLAFGNVKERAELLRHKYSCSDSLTFAEPYFEKKETIEIEIIPDFCNNRNIDEIDFLSIDTNGYELRVLEGAKDFLDNRKVGLIEVQVGMNPRNPKKVPLEKIRDFLEAKGYF